MTRRKQNKLLFLVVLILATIISLALFAKLRDDIPTLAKLYDFIRDMSLLIATVAVAYLANIYQKRQEFLKSLREQWRDIIQSKSELIYFCHHEAPTVEQYLAAARVISECIDNMRIVYANVGETDTLIGLFPYAPLHDMRIALEKLDPRKNHPSSEERYAARGQIWDAFNVIREHFLDEFDVEEPTRPILANNMKRMKQSGSPKSAERQLEAQKKDLAKWQKANQA